MVRSKIVVGDFVRCSERGIGGFNGVVLEIRHVQQPLFNLDYKLALVENDEGLREWVNLIFLYKVSNE